MNKVTQIHARTQRPRRLNQPITVGQWADIRAELRALRDQVAAQPTAAEIAAATAAEFKRQELVLSASLPPMPAPQWRDGETPFKSPAPGRAQFGAITMDEKTAIRRDENLLAKAKAVFGDDLVADAFVCVLHYGSEESVLATRLRDAMHKSPDINDRGLVHDAERIRLVFCNGRTVEFENSEWASMRNPTSESYEAQEITHGL